MTLMFTQGYRKARTSAVIVLSLHEATQMLVMVDYARKMIVKNSKSPVTMANNMDCLSTSSCLNVEKNYVNLAHISLLCFKVAMKQMFSAKINLSDEKKHKT